MSIIVPRDSRGRFLGWLDGCPQKVAGKISLTLIGHTVTENTKEKISKTLEEKDPSNWNHLRIPKTPRIKEKLRLGMLGKHNSPNTEFKKGVLAPHWNGFGKGMIPWNKNKKGLYSQTEETREKIRQKVIGEKNGMWQEGISFELYSSDWTETLKESIRQRDNYICQKCGKTQEEEMKLQNRKLNVHHIDYDKKNCDSNNLVALCQKCNSRANKNRRYWYKFFIAKLKEKNLGQFDFGKTLSFSLV